MENLKVKKTHADYVNGKFEEEKILHATANYRFIRITAFNFIFNLLYYYAVFFASPFFHFVFVSQKKNV